MKTREPNVVIMGGGGFQMEPDNPLLDDWLLSLTRVERPRVALIPTATGDSPDIIARFEAAFGPRPVETDVLRLFRREVSDIAGWLAERDLIYVTGGNTANMLAIWRVHGVDEALRAAWQSGVVIAGLSAGSLCWFECGVTDSFGAGLAPLHDGLGWLSGSHCPHYDGEALRRPRYRELIGSGALPDGWAVDDGVALRFEGATPQLVELVSSRPAARAFRVERAARGEVIETEQSPRVLGG